MSDTLDILKKAELSGGIIVKVCPGGFEILFKGFMDNCDCETCETQRTLIKMLMEVAQ